MPENPEYILPEGDSSMITKKFVLVTSVLVFTGIFSLCYMVVKFGKIVVTEEDIISIFIGSISLSIVIESWILLRSIMPLTHQDTTIQNGDVKK
jgi:hypothetical protein